MAKSELTEAILCIVENPEYNEDDVVDAVISWKAKHNSLTFKHVLSIAAFSCGVTSEDVKSRSRKRECVRARMLVYKYYKTRTKMSLAKIGRLFKHEEFPGYDHATVLHGIRNLNNDLETNFIPTVYAWERFSKNINL